MPDDENKKVEEKTDAANRSPNEVVRFITEPFQEDNGNYSAMRLMAFVSLGASIFFGYLLFSRGHEQQAILQRSVDIIEHNSTLSPEKKALLEKIIDSQRQLQTEALKTEALKTEQSQNGSSEEFLIVLSFLSAAFAGKFAQKFLEPKEGEDFDFSSGKTTTNSGDTTTNSGDTTTNSGDTATNSGKTTTNSGDTTTNSGDTATNSGDTTTNSGDTTTNSGQQLPDSRLTLDDLQAQYQYNNNQEDRE